MISFTASCPCSRRLLPSRVRHAQRVHHQLNSLQGRRDFLHVLPPQDPLRLESAEEPRPRVNHVLLLKQRLLLLSTRCSWPRTSRPGLTSLLPTLPPATPSGTPSPSDHLAAAPAPPAGMPLPLGGPPVRLASPGTSAGPPLPDFWRNGAALRFMWGLPVCVLCPPGDHTPLLA